MDSPKPLDEIEEMAIYIDGQLCHVPNCKQPRRYRDLCTLHYQRKQRGADLFRAPKVEHGLCLTPEYASWNNMKARCLNPKNKRWENYGGRGIKVCQRWDESFLAFLADMGRMPKGYTLERKDNDGDYEPSNCLWIPKAEQMKNTSLTVKITINGETLCIKDWARKWGMPPPTLYSRWRQWKRITKQTEGEK